MRSDPAVRGQIKRPCGVHTCGMIGSFTQYVLCTYWNVTHGQRVQAGVNHLLGSFGMIRIPC